MNRKEKKITAPIYLKLLIIAALFLNISCDNATKVESKGLSVILDLIISDSAPSVSVDSLAQSTDNIILLDSREREEYAVSHIAGAKHVGYDYFDSDSVSGIDKDAKMVVYCSVGSRSEKITLQLKEMGFNDVNNLYGGIFEWINQGYDVVNKTGKTDSIHAYSRFWGLWLQEGEKVYSSSRN